MRRGPVVLVIAVVAATAVVVGWRARRTPDRVLARLAGATRPIEGRLSRAAADRHRPFVAAVGKVTLDDLSWLEGAGDRGALAEAEILGGQLDRALEALAGTAPELVNDRAAVALARGQAQEALRLCNQALAAGPARRAPLLWNRALALAGLELPVVAATQLEELAQLGEPGWSDEARARARVLRAGHQAAADGFAHAVDADTTLALTGKPPADEVERGWPDLTRLYLYEAIRMAPSAERVRALLPLARRLDAGFGGHVLEALATRVAASDFAARAPLADAYRGLFKGQVTEGTELAQLIDRLRRTPGSDDITLGVMQLSGERYRQPQRYIEVARRQHDPWFDAAAAESEAAIRPDVTQFELVERTAIARCWEARLEFRCLRLTEELTALLTDLSRVNEADRLALDGRKRAQPRDPETETLFLFHLAEIARRRNDTDLMNAYLDELLARQPQDCTTVRRVHELKAQAAFLLLRPEVARRELFAIPASCKAERFGILGAFILGNLLHLGGSDEEYRLMREAVANFRAESGPAGRLQADTYEGRGLLERDEAAGEAMLRKVVAEIDAQPAPDAATRRTREDAYGDIIIKGAQHGAWPRVLRDVVADLHLRAPPPCTLAVLLDSVGAVSVWRDAAGAVGGRLGVRHQPTPTPADVTPEEVLRHLDGCPEVRLLALPPLHGRPDLLPTELAWGFGLGSSAAPKTSSGSPRRLIVTDVEPPAALRLPPLAPHGPAAPGDVVVRGAAATPARVLAELPSADEIELDVHGFIDLSQSEASMLVLSPDGAGRYALSATEIARLSLPRKPLVVLAACNAAHTAPFLHESWSLPTAFNTAGARATFGSSSPIPDLDAARFFDEVVKLIHDGTSPAVALRDVRRRWLARGQRWTADVMLFQ